VLTVLGIGLLITSAAIVGSQYYGHGRAGRTLSSASLPPGLGPAPSSPSSSTRAGSGGSAAGGSQGRADGRGPAVVPNRPGVPVTVIVAGHRVNAPVSADRLNADGTLYVPPDPRTVSWASQDMAPGSSSGTVILVGHVNYGGVAGAFSDLADYQVGQIITLVLADGRHLKYAVAASPIEVDKDKLGPRRQELFDQTHSYGPAGRPKSGRLLLLSCGGVFDNRTGHYESNIFVYAFPV
jgi:Sortase domain